MSCKYIVVVGGVYSGTGKGISAASLGLLLKLRGANITLMKCDPYLNMNAGTMNPHQHGEVFLCDDGSETDLDLGHYERLAGITVSRLNICTSGTINEQIREAEVAGKYLGHTVQIVPHVTDMIQERLAEVGKDMDIVIVEIGGTVGDFESGGFYEAISQLKHKRPEDVVVIMVAPVIWNDAIKEFKTKPLQNSIRSLRHDGLTPEILLCRCEILGKEIPNDILDKISRLTGVPREAVFEAPQVKTIYQVPIEFYERHIDDLIADRFHLTRRGVRIHKYRDLVERYVNGHDLPQITIGIVGKYDNCDEAYLSLKEALIHASVQNNVKTLIRWISAEDIEKNGTQCLKDLSGLIVPGGFGSRGVEGKIAAIQYCRKNKMPFLGICLGLQCAVIEFARNVMDMDGATSQEFDEECDIPVVHYMEGQSQSIKKSGTMRLGAYDCELEKESLARMLYKKKLISERHRHRLEVNEPLLKGFQKEGFVVSGRNPQTGLVEVMELNIKKHPFFVGTQAHPEFKSRLGEPAPLFDGLVKAASGQLNRDDG